MEATIPFSGGFIFERDHVRRLVAEAKAGDTAAFSELLRLYERLVLRIAQRIVLNREAARDIAQDVFLRFHRHLGRIDGDRDVKAWLSRTTANLCFDFLRSRGEELPLDVVSERASDTRSPEDLAGAEEERSMVVAALARLTPHERAAIVLRDLEGCSTAEVARILGSSEGTVRTHLSTGRNKLRNSITLHLGRKNDPRS
jgi:RNA polymerase sigma-70 factor (ECF subfamily)